MRISEFAIRRGVATTMLFALVILLGSVAIPELPLEFMPEMDAPFIEVHVPYEGASPVEICDRIAEPVEEAVATLPGIQKMRTRCRLGYAYIGIELNSEANMDYMVLDVQERIDSIKKDLPSDVRNIFIAKFDTQQMPIIMGAVTFPENDPENNQLLDRYLIRPLKTVDGVADINIEGLEERRVLVEIDQNKLTAYGVSVIQVFEALRSANMTLSAGTVRYADKEHSVRIVGEFESLAEIRRLPVNDRVKVGDVAEVKIDYVEPFFIGRINGQRAYIMMILKESGANTVQTSRAVHQRMAELLEHPRLKGVKMKVWFDQAREITTSIDILTETGVVGAALAFLVLWVFLKSIRSTLIVSAAIPMSVLTTVACMYFLGLTFNVITLSALIVGIGMLVDNSIVVLEAIDLRRRQGMSPAEASIAGAKEVGLAITVATTTTIIVFLPLIFTEQSSASILMKQMGMVLALAIGSSLFVSLTLIPLLTSRVLTSMPTEMPGWYRRLSEAFFSLLDLGLAHRGKALASVGFIFLVSVLAFSWPAPFSKSLEKRGLTGKPLIEKEAVPKALMRLVRITVEFEHKPAIEEVGLKMRKLEKLFMEKMDQWDLDTVSTIVTPIFNRILLVLPNDRMPRYDVEQVSDMARDFIKDINWPGVKLKIEEEGMHGGPPGMGRSTSIKVRGPDPEQVYSYARDIREMIKTVPGLKEIREIERLNEEEVHVIVDRNLARQYGFETNQVAMAVSYSIRGVPVGQLLSSEVPLDIYIQVQEADRKTLDQLESMMVQNLRGQYIPLKNIAEFKVVPIPEVVRRDNRLITVRVPVVPEGKDLSTVKKRISNRLSTLRLPTGYSWAMGEEFEEGMEDLKTLAIAIGLAMVLVFLVMTAQFESFFLPFVIMFTLPFAMIGVVLGLLISRATFNILSGAGCLLLVGIVVNNAIVLVDHVNNLRKQGYGPLESLRQASRDRFRPIMMTALTTIVGLGPMALGLNDTGRMMYSPMAIAVLGGLVVSTFLTPFVIPIIFSMSDSLVTFLKGVWQAMAKA